MQLLCKFKCPLLKSKPKIIFLKFYFEFFNTHISHLTQHFMLNMALKWHHKNISNNIIIFVEFWRLPDMFFGSFDCDYMPIPRKTPFGDVFKEYVTLYSHNNEFAFVFYSIYIIPSFLCTQVHFL